MSEELLEQIEQLIKDSSITDKMPYDAVVIRPTSCGADVFFVSFALADKVRQMSVSGKNVFRRVVADGTL